MNSAVGVISESMISRSCDQEPERDIYNQPQREDLCDERIRDNPESSKMSFLGLPSKTGFVARLTVSQYLYEDPCHRTTQFLASLQKEATITYPGNELIARQH